MTLLARPRSPVFATALLCLVGACSRPADGGGGASNDTGGGFINSSSSAGDDESDESGGTGGSEGSEGDWACGEGPTHCAQRPIGINDTTKEGLEVQRALGFVLRDEGWEIDWRIDDAGSTELKLSILDPEAAQVLQMYGLEECGSGGFNSGDCNGGFELEAPGHLESSDGRIDLDAPLHVAAQPIVGVGYFISVSLDADAAANQGSLPEWVEIDGLAYNVMDLSVLGSFSLLEGPEVYETNWTVRANEGMQVLGHKHSP